MSYLSQNQGDEDPTSINLDEQTALLGSIDAELDDQGNTLDNIETNTGNTASSTATTASNTGTIATNTGTTATNTGTIVSEAVTLNAEVLAQGVVQDRQILNELDSIELLGEIVNELKQIKFHLSMGSDMSLDNGDTVD